MSRPSRNSIRFASLSATALAAAALAAFGATLMGAGDARALTSDRDKEIRIAADHFSEKEGEGVMIWEGNVEIYQGTLKVFADRAQVARRGGEVVHVTVTGTPARMQQRLDDQPGLFKARAARIEYDVQNEVVVLIEDVVIEQQRGELTGPRVRYNIATGQVDGGTPDGDGRIHLRIQPKQGDEQDSGSDSDGDGQDAGGGGGDR